VIILCYDGSDDARAAIQRAGALLADRDASVLTVWEGLAEVLARTGTGFGMTDEDVQSGDDASERGARDVADEGAQLAAAAGFNARARPSRREVTVWSTILREAEAVDASAIVMGTRGLTGVRSLVLGSVSHAVVQHSARPVIIVPSAEVASRRAGHYD
jgi:nucleotide-binding universal stress UspA family protein